MLRNGTGESGDVSEEVQLPLALRNWLGRLRLLYGVPFAYLVPDERLLPVESVRFFYIDRNWTDRLVDGALSVGKISTRDYAHHHAVNDIVRCQTDDEERCVRARLRPSDDLPSERAEGIDLTGMLIRSRVVSGWPGLEVRAYRGEKAIEADKLPLLRMERPAPDILLCLWSGIPKLVDVEEPREGILFGVDLRPQGRSEDCPSGFELKLRYIHGPNAGWDLRHSKLPDPNDAQRTGIPDTEEVTVAVPVRRANPRVVHVKNLAARLDTRLQQLGIQVNPPATPLAEREFTAAELAVEMLQFPYCQHFVGDRIPESEETPEWILADSYAAATFNIGTVMAPLSEAEMLKLFPKDGGNGNNGGG
jgi:hypothetical protein